MPVLALSKMLRGMGRRDYALGLRGGDLLADYVGGAAFGAFGSEVCLPKAVPRLTVGYCRCRRRSWLRRRMPASMGTIPGREGFGRGWPPARWGRVGTEQHVLGAVIVLPEPRGPAPHRGLSTNGAPAVVDDAAGVCVVDHDRPEQCGGDLRPGLLRGWGPEGRCDRRRFW